MSTEIQQAQHDLPSYQLHHADSMLKLASTLADFVKERNLSQNIQGRQYVNIEGWQFCGGMMGILPIITCTEDSSTNDEIMFEAHCDLININTGAKVGYGHALCSNKEKGKKFFEAYAINSMAQTRAIGKAYRNMIGWLMKAAGYEATPSEEMDQVAQQENEIKEALWQYMQAQNRDEATAVWNKYPQYKKHPAFMQAAKAMGLLFPKQEEQPKQEVVILASQKQIDLISNLVNSHHIDDDYKDFVSSSLEEVGSLTSEEAGDMITKLQGMIDAGLKYESTNPATKDLTELIEIHWDKPYFTADEKAKGLASLNKGYTIAQARSTIAKLEKMIDERSKAAIPNG